MWTEPIGLNVYNSIVNMRKKITLIKKSRGTRSPAFITKCLAIAATDISNN